VVSRTAFTLIELIFAIVIVAIVFLALPTMSSSSSDAVDTSLTQEAIFPMSARLSQVLSYRWDDHSENNASENNTVARTVDVNFGGTGPLDRVGTTDFRVGHIQDGDREYHRSFHPATGMIAFQEAGIAFDGNNDIDDHDTNGSVNLYTQSGDLEGYKKNYLVDIDVTYFSDALAGFTFTAAAAAAPSNMKMITIALDIPLSDGSGNFDTDAVVLRTYAANIGEVAFFHRIY